MSNTNKQTNRLICLAIVLIMVMGLAVTIFALKVDNTVNADELVNYCEYDFDGNYVIKQASDCTKITATENFASGGWYLADENVTVTTQNITPTGDVNIIVKKGVVLKFEGRISSTKNFKVYGEDKFSWSGYGEVQFSTNVTNPSTYGSYLNDFANFELHCVRSVFYCYPVDNQKAFRAGDTINIINGYQSLEFSGSKTDYDNISVTAFEARFVNFYTTNLLQSNWGVDTRRLDKFINALDYVSFNEKAEVSLYAANIGINVAGDCDFSGNSRFAYQDEHAGERAYVTAYGIKATGKVRFKNSGAHLKRLRYGIYADGEITISGNSSNIDASDSRTVCSLYSNTGITINGGQIVAAATNWEGGKIETTGTLTVRGGKVEGYGSPEGITAANIVLENGTQFLGKDNRSAEYGAIALNDGSYAQYTKKPYMLIKQAPVKYLEYNETTGEFDEKEVDVYNVVTAGTTFNEDGWYVVNSEDIVINDNILQKDNDRVINLILADSGDGSATNKLTLEGQFSAKTLNVFGQAGNAPGVLVLGNDATEPIGTSKAVNLFDTLRIDGGEIQTMMFPVADLIGVRVDDALTMNGGALYFMPANDNPLAYKEDVPRGLFTANSLNVNAGAAIMQANGLYVSIGALVMTDSTISGTMLISGGQFGMDLETGTLTIDKEAVVLINNMVDAGIELEPNSHLVIKDKAALVMSLAELDNNCGGILAFEADVTVSDNATLMIRSKDNAIYTDLLTVTGFKKFELYAESTKALNVDSATIPDGYTFKGKNAAADNYVDTTFDNDYHYVIIAQSLVFDSFVWSQDGKTAQVKLVSPDNPTEIKYEDADMSSSVQTPATCEVKGTTRYTATYGTEAEYRDVQDIDALGHEYVYSEFEWAQDYYSAKAVYVCERDNTHIAKYDAQITSVIKQDSTETEMGISTITATYDGHSESKDVTDIPVKKKTLEDNGVSVQIKDGSVFDGHISIKVELKTSVKSKDTQDYAKILAILEKDDIISKVYDVKLIKTINGVATEIQPQDIKEGTVISVHIKLPQGIEAGAFRVLHIHSVDDLEFIDDYTQEGDELVFEVSKFSEFAFITKDTAHGFCIGWVVLIFGIFELLFLAVYVILRFGFLKGLVEKCKLDCLYKKMNLLGLIGLCVSDALFIFALISLCLHQCTLTIISAVLILLMNCTFRYFFLKDSDILNGFKAKCKKD